MSGEDWGQGAANNTVGWGQGAANGAPWGAIHELSWGHPRTNLVGSLFDPDYQEVLDYWTANAITLPTSDQQAKGNALMIAVKASGDWDNVINFLPIKHAGNIDGALTDWKQLRQWTAYNSPAYDPDTGFTFNGTNYIRSDELSNIASMQDFSFGLVFKESASGYYAGEYNSSSQQMGVQSQSGVAFRGLYQALSVSRPQTGTEMRRCIVNAGPSTAKFYYDGVEVGSITSVATTPPNRPQGWTMGGIQSGSLILNPGTDIWFGFRGVEMNDPIAVDTAIRQFCGFEAYADEYEDVLAYALVNSVTVPTAVQKSVHNERLEAWIADGIWASRDFAFHFEGSNADFALIDWKRLVMATAVNSPSYNPDKGFASNGSSSYIDLNFTAGSGHWLINNGGVLAKFDGTTFISGHAHCLGTDIGSTVLVSPYFNTNQAYGRLGEDSSATASALANAQGIRTFSGSKNSSTREVYLDGTLLNSAVIVPGSSFQPTRTLKYQSTYASPNFSISILLGGGGFSPTQALAFHNSVI
jgi:hypothetical protein